MVGATSPVPTWLQVLLGEKFFCPCHLHDSAKKNEKNIFCLDCCASICPHCLPLHESHSHLQIRRYVYRDVIRLDDAQKLLNCSHVQPYIINSAKVVFLKQRPVSRPLKGSGNFCATCDRSLQDSYIFCSLSCKVHNQMTNNFGSKRQLYNHNHKYKYLYSNSKYLKRYPNSKSKNCNNLEDDHLTIDYAIDSPKLESTISKSTSATTMSYDRCEAAIFNALTNVRCNEFVKQKCMTLSMNQGVSSFRYLPDSNITSLMNRRKGIPRRSHLY